MTWRDFRIGWRMLLQQPAYSVVVIGGLAVGFAACFLMFGYVAYCLNYNSTVPDNDRVVAVKARINIAPRPAWQLEAALPLRDVALNSGLVSAASIAKLINFGKPLRVGAEQHDLNVVAVDPAFRTLFNLTALEGDLPAALSRPDGLALTRTAAAKLFGSRSALGHTVQVNDITLQVLAVIADPPANGSAWYQALVGTASSAWLQRDTAYTNWENGAIYLKLKPGASMASLAALLEAAAANSLFDRQFREGPMGKSLNGRNVSDVRLVALRDAYFDDDLASSSDAYGRRSSVLGMAAGGLLVLMLGTINYVNLATVRTLRRQREIGLRKLLGASTGQLVRQFLSEAVLTTMLAAAAGLLLAWLLLPTFSGLVDRDLAGSFTAAHGVIALVFSVAVGLAAGAYPAWLARHALPAAALTGRGSSETIAGLWARRVLTVLQFGSAMALSACTLAVGWQTWYASHASPGFDTQNLLVMRMPFEAVGKAQGTAFIEQLKRVPGVDGVATITEVPGRDGVRTVQLVSTRSGGDMSMESKEVSPNWFDLHHLHAVLGRSFNPALDPNDDKDGDGVMLNAAGAMALGYASPQDAVGQMLPGGPRIIGIAPEIRFQDLHAQSKALIYRVRPAGAVTVRIDAPLEEAWRAIEPVWRRNFPNATLDLKTQQAVLAERYADDERLMRILVITSLTAIALAAFGIYVLSAYSVQRNRRQIVLRKLHGAGRKDIALMLGREFSILVGVGALIGLPPAIVATQRYLASYTEHAPVGIWTPAAALLLAMLVALLATTRHTRVAMRMSPALALREQE